MGVDGFWQWDKEEAEVDLDTTFASMATAPGEEEGDRVMHCLLLPSCLTLRWATGIGYCKLHVRRHTSMPLLRRAGVCPLCLENLTASLRWSWRIWWGGDHWPIIWRTTG